MSVRHACSIVFRVTNDEESQLYWGVNYSHLEGIMTRVLATNVNELIPALKITPVPPHNVMSQALPSPPKDSTEKTIVGIRGKKGSGKSTLASFLARVGYVDMSFAEPLKELCQWWFGLSYEQTHDAVLKETVDERLGTSPRRILQVVGTEIFRDTVDGIWIKNMRIRLLNSPSGDICISDVRFPDELDFIYSLGGYDIEIRRHDVMVNDSSLHTSETALDSTQARYVIHNTGSIDDLEKAVCALLAELAYEELLTDDIGRLFYGRVASKVRHT